MHSYLSTCELKWLTFCIQVSPIWDEPKIEIRISWNLYLCKYMYTVERAIGDCLLGTPEVVCVEKFNMVSVERWVFALWYIWLCEIKKYIWWVVVFQRSIFVSEVFVRRFHCSEMHWNVNVKSRKDSSSSWCWQILVFLISPVHFGSPLVKLNFPWYVVHTFVFFYLSVAE